MSLIIVRLDEFIAPLNTILIIKGEHNNIWFKVANMEHQCRVGFVNESSRNSAWEYLWTTIKDAYVNEQYFLDFRSEVIIAQTNDAELAMIP